MRPIHRIATLSTALILAACGGTGTPTTAPVTSGPAATTAAAAPCAAPTDPNAAADVEASVGDNTWSQPVTAKVGDVITWSNSDGVPHKVALDDLSCAMPDNIPGGGKKSLVFSVAGTFPFHCAVHASMKGTIKIS